MPHGPHKARIAQYSAIAVTRMYLWLLARTGCSLPIPSSPRSSCRSRGRAFDCALATSQEHVCGRKAGRPHFRVPAQRCPMKRKASDQDAWEGIPRFQPGLGTRSHPAPFTQGRPPGTWAHERYSEHPSIDEVPSLHAASLAHGIRVDGKTHRVNLMDGTPLQVQRHRARGPLVQCPRQCGRRVVALYRRDQGGWGCRCCLKIRYPSQRLSAGRRKLASQIRRSIGLRTLQTSLEAVLQAEGRMLGIVVPLVPCRAPVRAPVQSW
jgi:hypothetical protein